MHKKLPVLGGRTPLQAVNDPDGREIGAIIVDRLGATDEKSARRPSAGHGCSPPTTEPLSADQGLNNERL